MNPISTRRHGPILVVRSDNPPVNALSLAVRKGLVDAIEQADANPSIDAVVLIGEGQTFFAGADITELDKPIEAPSHCDLVDRIEACIKPVVAAIHGTALGGGLEVALACHYRIAVPSAKLGLPEVKLGLLAGAGGTQRLPRLVGLHKALKMVTNGEPIGAAEAHDFGLLDQLVDGDLLDGAIVFAERIREARPLPRVSELNEKLAEARANPMLFDEFREANAKKFRGLTAPEQAIRAIEMATSMPYAEGAKRSFDLFLELANGVQAKALQYLFFATRKASKIEGLPADIKPRDVRSVGVIGAGTMGGGISMNFLSAGLPVTILETTQQALDHGISIIRRNYEATAAKGRMTADDVERAMGLLMPTVDIGALANCDLVIEAVFEDMAVKKQLFARLDRTVKPGAILASNTSFLDLDEIAAATSRPQHVVGLHFFSPANIMKLLEIVRGAKTAPDVLLTAMQLSKRIGKVAAISGVCEGFIGNRMLMPRQEQATRLLLEGATPEQVDRVHVAFGMPMGPFQMIDLTGIDIGWHRDPTRIESIADALCAIGRWGQKKGRGFYDYDDRRRPIPSPEVSNIVNEFRTREAIEPREISDHEIVERTLYTMVNEGAKILEEGVAQRVSDIDVVWTNGYGWPRHTGGPMFWADTEGLSKIVEGLERQRGSLGGSFKISALLLAKAASGQSLTR